jgi:hypothetical protein
MSNGESRVSSQYADSRMRGAVRWQAHVVQTVQNQVTLFVEISMASSQRIRENEGVRVI